MKRRVIRLTSEATLPTSASYQQHRIDPAQQVVREQREGQAEHQRDRHRAGDTQAERGADQRADRRAPLAEQLEHDLGHAPLGDGEHQAGDLDRERVLAPTLGPEHPREQDAGDDAEGERRQAAGALAREAHRGPVRRAALVWPAPCRSETEDRATLRATACPTFGASCMAATSLTSNASSRRRRLASARPTGRGAIGATCRCWRAFPRDQPVLELGCGPGQLLEYLGQRGFARRLGIDLSEEQVRRARARGSSRRWWPTPCPSCARSPAASS